MTAIAAMIVLALAGEASDDLLRRAQDARLAGDFAAARRIIDEAPGTRTPEELFDAAFSSVREAEEAERIADSGKQRVALVDAARRLDEVLNVAPDFDEARNDRALVNFALGNEQKAYDDLATAIEESPGDRVLYRRNLGDLYARSAQPGRAAAVYAAVLGELPYDSGTLESLLELRLERSADGAEELLRLARGSGGPLASAGPLRVLRAPGAPRPLQDRALVDLARDFAERLPVEPLETFRGEVGTMPGIRQREALHRLMSDQPLGGRYPWWRETGERRATMVALLHGRALRALADGQDSLASALAAEAAQLAGEEDLAAARKVIEFAMAAGDDERAAETIKRMRGRHPGGFPKTKDAADLERVIGSMSFEQDDTPPVYFDKTKSELRENEKERLRKLAERAKREGLRLDIVGHTDNEHSDSSNLDLSRRRAEAVRDFLLKEGVSPGQIEVKARGEKAPAASNLFGAGRRKNRRAEIRIGQ